MERKAYPTDVSDEEWAFIAPYLTLMKEDAPQRDYSLREVFNGLRYIMRSGEAWRMMPHDLPPWYTVYQQMQRWQRAYSKRLWMTCGLCCVKGQDTSPNPVRSSWTVG